MRTSAFSAVLPVAFVATLLAAAPPRAFAACGDAILQPNEVCVSTGGNVLAAATNARAVLAVDVDGDGNRDVVSVTLDTVFVRLGTGTGLSTVLSYAPGMADFRDVSAGDFDGDVDLELTVADAMGNQVWVLEIAPTSAATGRRTRRSRRPGSARGSHRLSATVTGPSPPSRSPAS